MKKFLILPLLGFFSLNIYANSCPGQFDPASGICRFQGNNGELVQYNIAPPQENVAPPKKVIETTIIHKASKYGALAYSQKVGHIAGALNKNSKLEAIQSAKKQCEQGSRGHSCKVITWVRNGCVAAAIGTLKGKSVITPAAEVPGKAESVALSRCKVKGAKTCEILMPEGCSVPDGMYN